MKSRMFLFSIACLFSSGVTSGQGLNVQPDALKKWQHMRFGMFVTGEPSVLSGPPISWSRGTKQISIENYDQLYQQFNPTRFDADAWALTAKAAGAKYLVLITKHHDGFCLWPSEYTEYDIMATPFKRDIVGEVAAACRKHGIAFGAYYFVADWYHPKFWTRSPSGKVENPDADRDA